MLDISEKEDDFFDFLHIEEDMRAIENASSADQWREYWAQFSADQIHSMTF